MQLLIKQRPTITGTESFVMMKMFTAWLTPELSHKGEMELSCTACQHRCLISITAVLVFQGVNPSFRKCRDFSVFIYIIISMGFRTVGQRSHGSFFHSKEKNICQQPQSLLSTHLNHSWLKDNCCWWNVSSTAVP